MTEWETVHFEDEDLPRAFTRYRGVHCICEPSSKNSGKYDASATTSEGDWQQGPYKLVHILETWNEKDFEGIATLKQAQELCIKAVDLYHEGKIKPTYTERSRKSANNVKSAVKTGTNVRRKKSRR